MSDNQGWISLHRKIQDNPMWLSEKFTKSQAWIDLLMLACHKEKTLFVRGIEISLKPGDLFWSQEELAKRWKWNRRTVNKFVTRLVNESQIAYFIHNRIGVISIINWAKYQVDDDKSTRQSARQNTQDVHDKVHTNNNDNNVNNENNVNTNTTLVPVETDTGGGNVPRADFDYFINFFNETFKNKYRPTDTLRRKYKLRRKLFSKNELDFCIYMSSQVAFYRGENDRGWTITPEYILRNDENPQKILNWDDSKKTKLKSYEQMRQDEETNLIEKLRKQDEEIANNKEKRS